MATRELQAIIDQDKPYDQILQEVFDYDDGVWCHPGQAPVQLVYNDTSLHGWSVTGFRSVNQTNLEKFQYTIGRTDTTPHKLVIRLEGEFDSAELRKIL